MRPCAHSPGGREDRPQTTLDAAIVAAGTPSFGVAPIEFVGNEVEADVVRPVGVKACNALLHQEQPQLLQRCRAKGGMPRRVGREVWR